MAFPPVHDPAYGLSAEALEYARQRYEETEDSQRSIAEDIGKSRGTLDRIAKARAGSCARTSRRAVCPRQ
jgi:hypothetical protein